jgi:four helix bundle protein
VYPSHSSGIFEISDYCFGSLRELRYQVSLASRLGYIVDQDSTLAETNLIETEKVLNGLIQAVKASKKSEG